MPLHTDFRPETFDDFIGSEAAVAGLSALLQKDSPNRSILLSGPSGCGKTTLARILSWQLGLSPESPDYNELNTSDFRGVEMVRDMRKNSMYKPVEGVRVWLLDECHKLTPDAQEAMLKLLEHPPADTWFVLATTEPSKLKVTLRRRCAQFQVEPLTAIQIKKLCAKVAKASGLSIPKQIYGNIADECGGSPGLALSILDGLDGLEEGDMAKAIARIIEREDKVIALCRAMLKNPGWDKLRGMVKELEEDDPETVRRIILEYFRKVFLGGNEGAYVVMSCFREPFYNTGKAGLAMACFEATLD